VRAGRDGHAGRLVLAEGTAERNRIVTWDLVTRAEVLRARAGRAVRSRCSGTWVSPSRKSSGV